ncbi:uncharacterized protein HKW66_Vig0179930 [Vigna angularis]|uniref:Uncharacterized protein n=1 Tax=Phaseolus angularis TaxID=3914 RepID=A0A8T0K600_PHAAN|nr:uncharacterized protein HKW66_Vig0179930 [Vigna angularis]
MASSSSRRGKKAAQLLRNAGPNGWISDDEERYKYGVFISHVLKHHQVDLTDEDNALITPSASESDDEDDTTEVESMETSDLD